MRVLAIYACFWLNSCTCHFHCPQVLNFPFARYCNPTSTDANSYQIWSLFTESAQSNQYIQATTLVTDLTVAIILTAIMATITEMIMFLYHIILAWVSSSQTQRRNKQNDNNQLAMHKPTLSTYCSCIHKALPRPQKVLYIIWPCTIYLQ